MKSIGRARSLGLLAACAASLGSATVAHELLAADSASTAQHGFVGSQECAGCHTQIYDRWWNTRHAYSVLSGDEARDAGYPLPAPSDANPSIRGWQDVSYVVGGRQRISYADRAGQVLSTAYHNRIAGWSPFPSKSMTACSACHLTGVGTGLPHTDDPALPGRYNERNIGCESCHGPGAAHTASLEPNDIVVDASSRVCGRCHTSAGKILPKDDQHDTHDLVQNWNRDPHMLGVRHRSSNAFCADCHSPYERGDFTKREDGAAKRVFSESQQNITCISCHDPHALTDPHYRRGTVELGPPVTSQRQVYRGNDEDFTTTDFDPFESTEQVCLDCHRGADRVDLDHANATCNDCHNPFARNRQPESRAFHDANHPRLSCRPCHQDADHLMSVVYRDADFLEPRHVHNLRTLPEAVVARYGFKYPASRPRRWAALPTDPGGLSVPDEMSSASLRARLVGGGERGSALRSPPLSSQLDLARGHMASGEYTAVRGLLEQMGDGASAAYRSLLFAAGAARPALPAVDGESASAGNAAGREAEGRPAHVTRLWVGGLVELAEGRFARSSGILSEAHALEPANPNLGLHLGVAQIGERRYGAAAQTLEGVARDHPAHIATRIALGAIYINHERLALAKDHLDAVIAVDPMHALAAYFLGRTELRLRNPMEAASAFRTAVIAAPEDLNAWFHLARAYRAGEYYGAAVDTYEELIRRQPTLFDAHLDLAFLYKHLSDRVSIAHKRKSERARPVEISSQAWHRYLAQLDQRALEYGELALSTFDRAQQIRPVGASGELQIGEILRRSGRFEEARQRFEWLARSEPTEWVHRYRLGTIAIRQEDDARAIAHLEGALQLAPTEGDVYVALGLAHLKMGRTHDAIATLERGAIYEPFNPALFTNLGAAYLESDDLPRARKSLERALTLRTFPLPRTHLAYTNLGIVHWREGEKEAALQALESAVHVFPDYAYARRLLADARSINAEARSAATPVYDDLLERFGETSTVHFPNE